MRLVVSKILYIGMVLTAAVALSSCEGKANFVFDGSKLHGPLGIAIIPGTNFAVVASTNFDFSNSNQDPQQQGGILHALDLTTQELVPAAALQIPNFSGQIAVDLQKSRIIVTDRDQDRIRFFDFLIPGDDGAAISFSLLKTLDVGDDPFGVLLTNPTGGAFRKLFIANLLTDNLSLINADKLSIIDLDPEDDKEEALPLDKVALGSINLININMRPSRIVALGRDDLMLLSLSASGLLYVMDSKDNAIEAIYDLRFIAIAPEFNGMAVTNGNRLFLASHAIEGILMLDVSALNDNGVDNEVLNPTLLGTVITGSMIEDMQLSADGTKVYAAGFDRDSIHVLDAQTGVLLNEISVGRGPTELELTTNGSKLLVTNFLSNEISIIDTATDTVETTVE